MSARDPRGIIFDVKRFAADDGPGIRTTVFLKGCPLACQWCHSPESIARRPQVVFYEARCMACGACVAACPRGAQALTNGERRLDRQRCDDCGRCVEVCPSGALELRGRRVAASWVVGQAAADAAFYRHSGGGVTLSGGEPTAQPAFAEAILRGCRERDLHTVLDTNGFARWETLAVLMPYVDLFHFDLKHMDPQAHMRLTGVPNARIMANLRRLGAEGARVQVRLPLIPGLNDSSANVAATAAFAREAGAQSLALLAYNKAAGSKYRWLGRPYPLEYLETQSEADLAALADAARAQGIAVQVGG